MVLYQSKSGNTEKIAKAIAAAAKTEFHKLNQPYDLSSLQDGDIVFVGGGVYAGKCDPSVSECFSKLAGLQKNLTVALFGTSCKPGAPIEVMRKAAQAAGLNVHKDIFSSTGKFLLMRRSHPNAEDIMKAVAFAEKLLAQAKAPNPEA